MSARSIRRAAERRAKKLAAKAGLQVPTVSVAVVATEEEAQTQPLVAAAAAGAIFAVAAEPAVDEQATSTEAPQPKPISEAKLAANRANSQKSHGAVTEAGKNKSKLNAVKHGLTSATVLFASEADAKLYAKHTADYQTLYKPVGPEECALVQSITDIRWRLNTCPVLEFAVIAKGTAAIVDSDPEFWNQPGNQAELFLEVRRQNDRELRNLQLQENRLSRRYEREVARLERLQKERKAYEQYTMAQALQAVYVRQHHDPSFVASDDDLPGLGFDFSRERFDAFSRRLSPSDVQALRLSALAEAGITPKTKEIAA